MDIGLSIFPTDTTIQPVEFGKAAEDLGYESIWFPEHSHIPTSRTTPWGGREGAPPLPEFYWRTHDQFVALGAIAAVTSEIKLATGITLVSQRDPIWTAKEVATVDQLSGGRFVFGVGYGWNVEEMEDHRVSYGNRRARLRESVLAMKQLWTEDEAEFHGDQVNFDPTWAWPKPAQAGGPPVVLGGGAGPKTAAHIAEFCDGWMPIGARHGLNGIEHVHEALDAAGRSRDSLTIGVFAAKPEAEALSALAAEGVTRAVFALPQGDAEEVLGAMEAWAPLIAEMADA